MKKKRILLGLSAFALVGLATVLSSCDGDKKYTVKFVDGQQEITKTEVTGGYNVAVPEAPTADGKTFNGWYKDAALTDPFDFGSIINGDTTVYAAWLNEYGVTFKSGDTTYLIKPVTKGYNVAVPTAPTKEGYVFAGWYADSAFTTPFYFGTVIEADTTVYAKWVEEVVTYTVTYVSEQGTAPAAVELVTLPETLPVLEADGYEFGGWYLDETFETAAAAGTALTANVTLYAKWTQAVASNEVSFDAKTLTTGDTYVEGTTTDTEEEKADVTAAELCNGFFTVVGEGRVQKRSKQYKDSSNTKHYSSECVAIEAQAGTALQFTVTAPVKVTLSLQSTSSTNKSIFTLNKGEDAIAASNASSLTQNETANHYVITGASVEVTYELEAGTYQMVYLNEKAASSDEATVNRGGRFFTIEIEENTPAATYSVTYDVNGHGEAPTALTGVTALPATLPTLTADGFQFLGWATTATATEANVTAGTALTGDVTLYAVWQELQSAVTVSYVTGVDSVTLTASQAEKGGTLATLPSLADTVTNYVIEGFYTDQSYQTPFTTETVIADSMNVYVKLKAVYTVTFETAQGTAPAQLTKQTKVTFAELPTVSADYYIFKGWVVEGSTTLISADFDLNADTKLVAVFDLIPTYAQAKEDAEAEVVDPNDAKYSQINDFSNRDYVSPIYQASNSTGALGNKTVENYVEVTGEDGSKVFELKDTGGKATYFCVDSYYTKGTVEAVVDVTLVGQGNSWTLVRVVNASNQEVFGIRIADGKLKYRLAGSNDNLAANSDIAASNKLYHLYFKADLDNNKVLVCVDGKVLANLTIEDLTLDHIEFVSSDGGSKTMKISGVVLFADIEEADFVANIKARLTKLVAPYKATVANTDPAEYVYDQAEVTSIETAATEAIDAAQSAQELWVALGTANAQLRSLKTVAQKALEAAKETAIQQFATYIQGMTFEMKSAIDGETIDVATDFANAIENLTTEEAVTEALDDAKTNATAINDINADIIAAYKTLKQTALETAYPSSSYTVEKTAYDQVISDLTTALTGATTKADIDQAFADADTALSQVAKDTAKVVAKNALEKTYLPSQINTLLDKENYTNSQEQAYVDHRANVATALQAGKDIIDAADDTDAEAFATAISNAEKEVKDAIDAVRTATEWTVTFKKTSTDTTAYETKQVLKGGKSSKPETDPTLDGFVFNTWDFDFDDAIENNTTIYAKWYEKLAISTAMTSEVSFYEMSSAPKGDNGTDTFGAKGKTVNYTVNGIKYTSNNTSSGDMSIPDSGKGIKLSKKGQSVSFEAPAGSTVVIYLRNGNTDNSRLFDVTSNAGLSLTGIQKNYSNNTVENVTVSTGNALEGDTKGNGIVLTINVQDTQTITIAYSNNSSAENAIHIQKIRVNYTKVESVVSASESEKFIFRHDNAVGTNVADEETKIENTTETLYKGIFDIDASSGKLQIRNEQWAIFNNAIISFYVKENARVIVKCYNSSYSINEVTASSETTEYICTAGGKITLTATANNYIEYIEVIYPINTNTNITFGTEGNYTFVRQLDVSNATIGTFNTNNSQMSAGSMKLYVGAGAKVKVFGYGGSQGTNGNDNTSYTVTANEIESDTQTGDYEIIVNSTGYVTITSKASGNYLLSISVTFDE